MITIPAAQPSVGEDELGEVARVLRSGQLSQGPEVAAFEEEFAQHVNGRECVAVNSGTSALHLALLAMEIGPGDEVIVPSFSFAATANAVAITGAKPVFVDIDESSFCLDPLMIEPAITKKTRAIMPVHLYGHPANMSEIHQIAEKFGLSVLEDAAQAHGASVGDVPCGALGRMAAFSFYPTKNMTAGEGGMVVCASSEDARRVRMLRNQGMETRYQNEIVGLNNRMSDLHAAIGRVQLRKLPSWNKARRQNAARLSAGIHTVRVPEVADDVTHSFHQYTVRVSNGQREDFVRLLAERGIGSGVYYPTPIHRLAAYNLNLNLPRTDAAATEVVSLPVHPGLTTEQVDQVISAVNEVAEELR